MITEEVVKIAYKKTAAFSKEHIPMSLQELQERIKLMSGDRYDPNNIFADYVREIAHEAMNHEQRGVFEYEIFCLDTITK